MKTVRRIATMLVLFILAGLAVLFLYPRPEDTTDPGIFAADGALYNYCVLPELDGSGLNATDIPKAYTPDCGWQRWPMPVLAQCTEPLPAHAQDLRGLWQSATPGTDHVERIEQCGNRVVVTSAGIIHDFIADGTVTNGSRDIEPPSCMNTWVAIEWREAVLSFRPMGLPYVAVTRRKEGDELLWKYPGSEEMRMQRICEVPDHKRQRSPG